LWVTTDGGKHWPAAAYPGGSIVSLEVIDRQVLAVTMRRGMAGDASWALLRRPLAGGLWARLVTQASAIGNIATQARVAAIIDGTSVLVTGKRRPHHHQARAPVHGQPFPGAHLGRRAAPRGLALLCTGQGYTGHTDKTVYVSGEPGRNLESWQAAPPASAMAA